MSRGQLLAGLALAAAALCGPAQGQAQAQPALVTRGDYVVNRIGMCNDCHSPHDRAGGLVRGRELTGGPLAFAPSAPMPWAGVAPPIRGLPRGWSRAQTASFLETGRAPDGSAPRPPMPGYRMNPSDAQAAAAYLASLK